jgi:hypothetical protein
MPIPVPDVSVLDTPTVCLNLNEQWANIVSTALNNLLSRPQWGIDRNGVFMVDPSSVWDGDADFADQQIQIIMLALANGNCDPIVEDEIMPTGAIIAFMGSTIPDGWLLCDGSVMTGTDYPDLSTVLYGGVSDFQLPDLRKRFPIGASDEISMPPSPSFSLGVQDGGVLPLAAAAAAGELSSYSVQNEIYYPPYLAVNYIIKT